MKHYHILLFIFSFSFQIVFGQVDNTKPMYGEAPKSKDQIANDEKFIETVVNQFGTRVAASEKYIEIAWRYYYNDSLIVAMKRFNQAWMLNPENPDSYYGFGSLIESKGDTIEAKRLYNIGFKKDKSYKRALQCFQTIAICKEHNNDIKGTINAYKILVELTPNEIFPYKKLGYLYSENNNFELANKYYNKAIELDPLDATTYNNRGYLYQRMKLFDKAVKDYTIAIEINNEYISAYYNRGITHTEMKEFEKAKNDFTVCTKLDPNSGELFRSLGYAKYQLNDSKGACKDFARAKQLGDQQAINYLQYYCK